MKVNTRRMPPPAQFTPVALNITLESKKDLDILTSIVGMAPCTQLSERLFQTLEGVGGVSDCRGGATIR